MDPVFSADGGLRLTSQQWKGVGFLTEFARRIVFFGFSENNTPTSVLNVVKEIYRVSDHVVSGRFNTGTRPSCKTGCFWCCYLQVKATPLEVWCILDFLRACLGPRELSKIRQRLTATDERARGLDAYQRIRAKILCPLLAEKRCLVYPVRPIACRFYHSLDFSACELSLNDEDHRVPIRNDITGLGIGIFAGLTEGLRTLGLKTRLVELIAGLRIAMDEPSLLKRWLAGKPALLGAEIADAVKIEIAHRALIEELAEPWNRLSAPEMGDDGKQGIVL